MDFIPILSLLVGTVAAIGVIWQASISKRYERDIYRFSKTFDYSVRRLHRAREAVIKEQMAFAFLFKYKEKYADAPGDIYYSKYAEMSSAQAELRGLAFAIGDPDLKDLVNESVGSFPEADKQNRAQRMHTKISQLLEDEHKKSMNLK